MAVTANDLKNFAPSVVAESADSTNIGGAISSVEVTNNSLNELMHTMSAEASGGGAVIQYAKCFHKNTNPSSAFQIDDYGLWIANAIDSLGVASTIELVSTSEDDDSNKKVRLIGFDTNGNPIQEEITLNGITPITSNLSFKGRLRVEIRVSGISGVLTQAAGDITIKHNGGAVGVLPAGAKTANNEADIGLEPTLGGSSTIATPSTAPTGIAFSRPRTRATRLIVDSGAGTLLSGEAQGFWWRWTVVETMNPSSEVEFFIKGRGSVG